MQISIWCFVCCQFRDLDFSNNWNIGHVAKRKSQKSSLRFFLFTQKCFSLQFHITLKLYILGSQVCVSFIDFDCNWYWFNTSIVGKLGLTSLLPSIQASARLCLYDCSKIKWYVSDDVDFLFNSIPLGEITDFIIDEIYVRKEFDLFCRKIIFKTLLNKWCKCGTFLADGRLIKQIDACPMCGPTSVVLTNIFYVEMGHDVVKAFKPKLLKTLCW